VYVVVGGGAVGVARVCLLFVVVVAVVFVWACVCLFGLGLCFISRCRVWLSTPFLVVYSSVARTLFRKRPHVAPHVLVMRIEHLCQCLASEGVGT
jgi:hypothetical protein